jgi:F0F1-type ATP synthase assembly protein I
MEPINEIWELFKSHPESIIIIIVVWIFLMIVLDRLDIDVTPWIALMCFVLAVGVGVLYILSSSKNAATIGAIHGFLSLSRFYKVLFFTGR